jgi:hypothetical protein
MTESLKATLSTTPVLRIDTQAPLLDLFDAASHRLQTSVDLLDTLATLGLSGVEGADVSRFAAATSLLCQDGLDVLEVVRKRLAGDLTRSLSELRQN